jgi:hypothetical protein
LPLELEDCFLELLLGLEVGFAGLVLAAFFGLVVVSMPVLLAMLAALAAPVAAVASAPAPAPFPVSAPVVLFAAAVPAGASAGASCAVELVECLGASVPLLLLVGVTLLLMRVRLLSWLTAVPAGP